MFAKYLLVVLLLLLSVSILTVHASCYAPTSQGTKTGTSGEIKSDSDGKGTYNKISGSQSCTWKIQCPVGEFVALEMLYGRVYRTTLQVYDDLVPNKINDYVPKSKYSTFNIPLMSYSNVLNVKMSTTYSTYSMAYDYGFTVKWRCMPTRCSSVNATGNVTTFNIPDTTKVQTVISDTDGAASLQRYLRDEECNMTFVCSTARPFLLFDHFKGAIMQYATMKVTSPNASQPLLNYKGTNTNFAVPGSFASGPTASLYFNGGDSFSVTDGWTIQYSCMESQCTSVNGTSKTFQANSGVVISDQDGSSQWQQMVGGEDCNWVIQCPLASQNIRFFIHAEWVSALTIKFTKPSDASSIVWTWTYSYYTGYPASIFLGLDSAKILMTSTLNVNGATINWQCFDPATQGYCSSVNTSGVTFTERSGIILSDIDGVGSYPYASNETCTWMIQCPNSQEHIILYFDVNTYSSMNRIRLYDNQGTYTSSLYGTKRAATITDNSFLKLEFTSMASRSRDERLVALSSVSRQLDVAPRAFCTNPLGT